LPPLVQPGCRAKFLAGKLRATASFDLLNDFKRDYDFCEPVAQHIELSRLSKR
jgi:hypothetical protein